MLHEPAAQSGMDHAAGYKMRLGVWMFLVYGLIYAGFVAINVTKPLLMEVRVLYGMNLATVYGFGLIILALIMALIYNAMCNKKENVMNSEPVEKEDANNG
jgi:uncharacterized membrane protein (DUF485 family)